MRATLLDPHTESPTFRSSSSASSRSAVSNRVWWIPPTTESLNGRGCRVLQSNRPPWVALLASCSDAHCRIEASESSAASS